ncbi:MAG: hypothetical protein NW223_04095 [Hyphomicrobiaceae bacterium]|nr:hypothetical protein [Hyphomicrobiaceae bacterium]
MTAVTDEELMQFADRTLSAAEHARIAGLIAGDPIARARLIEFAETGRSLAEPFSAILNAPVPQHLVNIVMGSSQGARQPSHASDNRASWLDQLRGALALPAWSPALAFGALAAGALLGWFAHENSTRRAVSDDLLALKGGALVAQGKLAAALESAGSGETIQVGDAGVDAINVRLTFQGRGRGFCRQYELAGTGGKGRAGIGCRADDGTWQVEFNAPIKLESDAKTKNKLADDSKARLEAVVTGMMDSRDALTPQEEAAAIKGGWAR